MECVAPSPDSNRRTIAAPASQRTSIRANRPGPFERLLPKCTWQELPEEVRNRFEIDTACSHPKTYAGRVVRTRISRAGRILARLAGLIGTPLPETDGAVGPAGVSIAWNDKLNGQIWTRVYGRPGQFPQVVHSTKRFAGPTGLEEFVGPGASWGIGMTLRLSVEAGALVFRSDRYFFAVGAARFNLPTWCEPGRMTIRHHQIHGPEFRFTLDLEHRWFGPLIHQECVFSDCCIVEQQKASKNV